MYYLTKCFSFHIYLILQVKFLKIVNVQIENDDEMMMCGYYIIQY